MLICWCCHITVTRPLLRSFRVRPSRCSPLDLQTRQAISSHTTQAARDIKQAAAETGAALRGEHVDRAVVRETPLQATTSEHDPKRVVSTGESEEGKRY